MWLHRAQDAVSREEIKRLRQKQRETGMSECDYFLEECCCGARAGASCCPSFVRCCRCGGGEAEAAANGGGNGDGDESNGGRDDCAFIQGSRQI